MRSVAVSQDSVCHHLAEGTLFSTEPVVQDRTLELRYTKNSDFHDVVAKNYLENIPTPELIFSEMANRDLSQFVRPYVG
jgi:hypothetical protein